ncbi:MAG TPA: TIM-barrel domain-containing protein [Casimicrobiaceae bacterium]|nr:TIM-barrel domain-containing protein [Casimicrobiaceae bacterium]
MQLDVARFSRAIRCFARGGDRCRSLFDVELSGGRRVPAVVETYGDGIFRLRIGPQALPDYGLVIATPTPLDVVADDARVVVRHDDATLTIEQAPLRISVERRGTPVLQSITDEHFRGSARFPAFGADGERWIASFALASGEPVYGLGEKGSKLDRRGQLLHSHVEDALGVNTGRSYKNVPFCWSPEGWGVFVNTPGDVSHGVGYPEWSHRSYVALVDDEALDLFLLAADSPSQMLSRYTALTGRAPRIPMWGLGLWVSKAYYKTATEAIETAAALRDHSIPCDVLTLDGRAAWEVRTRFDFRWDETRYPDPKAALEAMRAFGLRICVWLYPYVSIHSPRYAELAERGFFLKRQESGAPYVFDWDVDPATSPFGNVLTPLSPSSIVDFTHPDAYAFWRDEHAALFASGVDVIKSDFGEHVPDDCVAHNGDRGRRLHNVYPLLYNRCEYEATQRYRREPAMVWGRAGWSGAQRYPMQWGGDPQSDWEGMCASIRGGLAWGLSGMPFYATDIGGFYGSQQPDAELYLRWLQWSVFSSHMRVHGVGAREPWAFGAEAEAIAKRWLRFRYRLLPYLKAMCDEASSTGLPVMRAMCLAFADDRLAWPFEEQFLCGDCLLIAPVKRAGGTVDVYLPRGADWIDLNGGAHHAGGTLLRQQVALDTLPHFGRVGHALPLGREVDRADAIDVQAPLDEAWLFGAQAVERRGFAQLRYTSANGTLDVECEGGRTRLFG